MFDVTDVHWRLLGPGNFEAGRGALVEFMQVGDSADF
jgi:hypothetical protein